MVRRNVAKTQHSTFSGVMRGVRGFPESICFIPCLTESCTRTCSIRCNYALMFVEHVTTAAELALLADDWEGLAAGSPMLGPRWMLPWWRHYGRQRHELDRQRELAVMAVFDSPRKLVALAPWFVENANLHGRSMGFLGSGEVCTDYLRIPCESGRAVEVARVLADELIGNDGAIPAAERHWDVLDFANVDQDCPVMNGLNHELSARGALIQRVRGNTGWRVPLPATWDEYLGRLSKSHRKQIRRLSRRSLGGGHAALHEVRTSAELPVALEILAHLHRQRRHSLGDRNMFADVRFAAFHREAARALLEASQLQLSWLEVSGEPVAAEYQVRGGDVVYAYQSGIDPHRLRLEPGRLATIATIRAAIERGDRAFDFMRGDEPYKAHWRAEPRPMLSLRVWPGTACDWVRQGLWRAGQTVRALVRDCRQFAGIYQTVR